MTTRSLALLSSVLLLSSGCGDDSGGPLGPEWSGAGRTPALRAEVTGTSVGVDRLEGRPWIECTVTLTAWLDARATESALPREAVFRFHLPGDRTQPMDSFTIRGTQLRQAFGGQPLAPGESATSGWFFRAGVPFAVTGYVQWLQGTLAEGTLVESPLELDCGPVLDPDDPAPPPVVTDVTVTHSDGDVEAGTTMSVDYTAQSTVGLWETWVILAGPLGEDTIRTAESLGTTTRRQIDFRFPIGTPPGSRLTVRIVAFDGTLRGGVSSPILTGTLVDTQPPHDARFSFLFSQEPCTPLLCQFASDSAIRFYSAAFDDGGLGWTRVLFGDPVVHRDSVWMLDAMQQKRFGSPGPLEGIHPVRAYIEDVAGNAVEFDVGDANFYPSVGVGEGVTRELFVSGRHRLAVDFGAARLYIVPVIGETMSVYDMETLTVLDEIPVPSGAGGVDIAPGGGRLVAALPDSGQVALFDPDGSGLQILSVLQPDPLRPLLVTHAVFTSEGSVVAVLNDYRGTSAAVLIDPATGEQVTLIDDAGAAPYDQLFASRSGDGRRVLLALLSGGCGRIYEVVDGTLSECAQAPAPLVGDETGERWVGQSSVHGPDLEWLADISAHQVSTAAPGPLGVVYLAHRSGLLRLDAATGLIGEKRPAVEYTHGSMNGVTMDVSPDGSRAVIWGKQAYRLNIAHTLISVIDLD